MVRCAQKTIRDLHHRAQPLRVRLAIQNCELDHRAPIQMGRRQNLHPRTKEVQHRIRGRSQHSQYIKFPAGKLLSFLRQYALSAQRI